MSDSDTPGPSNNWKDVFTGAKETTKVVAAKKYTKGGAGKDKGAGKKTAGASKGAAAKGSSKNTSATSSKTGSSKTAKGANTSSDKENLDGEDPFHVFDTIEHATAGGTKRLSIEKIYQRLSQLDHVLVRPDTYIGSVEKITEQMWVYDMDEKKMTNRPVTYVPGLYKIFDEILVNAADNKQRDKTMNTIKVSISPDKNEISVWNNGRGIPVVEHQYEKMYVPELIFGTLLTSSNFDDSQKKVTGGRNGYGAKLCNIFSTEFTVETSSQEYSKSYKQTWKNNMNKGLSPDELKKQGLDPKVGKSSGSDFTKITFKPDLKRFGMSSLDKDIVDLMARRAFDIAGTTGNVKVFLNGTRLPCVGFKEYVDQYLGDRQDDDGNPFKFEYEKCNDRWELAVTHSDKGFQQVSFVNSIATLKGGRHVDHVVDQLVKKVIDHVMRSLKKEKMNLKPFQVKNHLWIFVNCLIENPTFDSQSKETMTLQQKSFGSKAELSDNYVKKVIKNSRVVENIMSWVKFKQQAQLDQQCHKSKHARLTKIPKLEDANEAGRGRSHMCTLILTEGDSAKSLAVSGLGVVGRDFYGVFPLKGKLLNVRDAPMKQIQGNEEITSLVKILGLHYQRKYEKEEEMKTLRYGKVMVMADQDQDGSHIKGLVVNFIHHFWPSLIRKHFVEEFITPIVKVSKGKETIPFFSLPEYENWKRETDNWHTWKVKYYKGLGTSTSNEAKEYFRDMKRHRIKFKYAGEQDDISIEKAFSKNKIEERKDWLTEFMRDRKQRRIDGLDDIYLYHMDTTEVNFTDFVNKELVLYSNADNERSIPSLMDGFKPGQRKVLFTCFKRNLNRELKVAQLAGSVAEMSAYHHGEASLMMTIIGLAQNYVGSNNINVLMPIGQFGTRLQGGKDAASPRYIFTKLSPLARCLFHPHDDHCLRYLFDDNQKIEPEWYCPIIPMVLANGADGIGTGWSTKIPNFSPMDLVENIKRMIRNEEPVYMKPWYKNFRGTIEQLDERKYAVSGEVAVLDETTFEITELPIRQWTQNYKESVLDPYLNGTEKTPPIISDFKEYHTDTTVRFVVKMPENALMRAQDDGLHQLFKVQSTISTNCMVLFDADGVLRFYDSALDILKDFYSVRLRKYEERRDYLIGMLRAESSKLSEQARFILLKIAGKIILENRKKKDIVGQLIEHKFKRDPVKIWKDEQIRKGKQQEEGGDEGADTADEGAQAEADKMKSKETEVVGGYEYLLNQYLIKLSMEEKEKLERERDSKLREVEILESKTAKDLWMEDLDAFVEQYHKEQDRERQEEQEAMAKGLSGVATAGGSKKGGGGKGADKGRKKVVNLAETLPSSAGERIEPSIASLKVKVEAALKRGENKGRGRKKKGEEDLDLESRMKQRGLKSPKAKGGKPVEPSKSIARFFGTGSKKQAKENGEAEVEVMDISSPGKKKKKGGSPRKRKHSTTDSENEEDEISISDFEDDEDVQPRARPARQRKEIKYDFDVEDESDAEVVAEPAQDEPESDDEFNPKDQSDDDVVVKKSPVKRADPTAIKPKKAPAKPASPEPANPLNGVFSDASDSDAHSTKDTPSESEAESSGDDSGSDSDFGAPKGKKGKKAAKATKAKASPKKSPQKKKPAKAAATKQPKAEEDEVISLDDSPVAKTKKPQAKKPAAAAKPRSKKPKVVSSDDDDEVVVSGSDGGGDGDSPLPSLGQRAGGRARKPVKYNVDSGTDEDSE